MKFSVWDALSILTLMGLCVVGVIVASIFSNPASAFNPFPPPTLPASIVLPSGTPTAVYMPPTWTPVGFGSTSSIVKADTQTPQPTATGFVLPTFTPTETITPTETLTETPTVTKTSTKTKVPNTATPKPTIALVCLSISQSMSIVPPDTTTIPATSGSYSGTITINGDPSHKVSGASVTFSTSKSTTVKWTCSASDGSCPSSGSHFSVSSIKMFANGTVTINIEGVIPAKTKSGLKFSSSVHAPSGTSNQCNPSDSTSWTW